MIRTTPLKRPAILCLHQTDPNGKDSPVGLTDRPALHYAKELAQRGYVTLSPDYPSFGECKDYNFDADNYTSGTMKAIYDNTRAIDLLQSLPEVDPNRIGCIGHSLGGHNALFTAVFDPASKPSSPPAASPPSTNTKPATSPAGPAPATCRSSNRNTISRPTQSPSTSPKSSPRSPPCRLRQRPTARRQLRRRRRPRSPHRRPPGLQTPRRSRQPPSRPPRLRHDFLDTERQQAYAFLDQHLKRQSSR